MGLFSKLFKGPEVDMEKSNANAKKMRLLFNQAVENGDSYRLIFGYTEDVARFNYGFVHGSKTKIGNLIVGWNESTQTIVVVPTVPDLSAAWGGGELPIAERCRRADGVVRKGRDRMCGMPFVCNVRSGTGRRSRAGTGRSSVKIRYRNVKMYISPMTENG